MTLWPPDPTTVPEEFLLTGDEDADGSSVDVDPVFAGPGFAALVEDHGAEVAAGIARGTPTRPSLVAEGYRTMPVLGGVVALDPSGEFCGGYVGSGLAVRHADRGRGLGSELCLLRYVDGGPGVWELDTPAFSPGGRDCHLAVARLARDARLYATALENRYGVEGHVGGAEALEALRASTSRAERRAALEAFDEAVGSRPTAPGPG